MCYRVEGLGPWVQYVSGRKRPVGEMNGKSGNLNSCAAQLYPGGCLVPSSELICILDADQASISDLLPLRLGVEGSGDTQMLGEATKCKDA